MIFNSRRPHPDADGTTISATVLETDGTATSIDPSSVTISENDISVPFSGSSFDPNSGQFSVHFSNDQINAIAAVYGGDGNNLTISAKDKAGNSGKDKQKFLSPVKDVKDTFQVAGGGAGAAYSLLQAVSNDRTVMFPLLNIPIKVTTQIFPFTGNINTGLYFRTSIETHPYAMMGLSVLYAEFYEYPPYVDHTFAWDGMKWGNDKHTQGVPYPSGTYYSTGRALGFWLLKDPGAFTIDNDIQYNWRATTSPQDLQKQHHALWGSKGSTHNWNLYGPVPLTRLQLNSNNSAQINQLYTAYVLPEILNAAQINYQLWPIVLNPPSRGGGYNITYDEPVVIGGVAHTIEVTTNRRLDAKLNKMVEVISDALVL